MSDLIGGRYPKLYTFWKALGFPTNVQQGNLCIRSNLEYTGLNAAADTAAALTTAKATIVAVPIEWGDRFNKVTVITGAKAAKKPTHQWAAVYSGLAPGKEALLAQSKDGEKTEIKATTRPVFTLEKEVEANTTVAPNGYLYVAVSVTAEEEVPSLATVTPAAVALFASASEPWLTGAPIFSRVFSKELAATAPATVAETALQATAPIVLLS